MDPGDVTTAEEAKARGGAAWNDQDMNEAIRWFSRAIELDQDNCSGQLHVHYSNRSAAFLKKNKLDRALQDAERCIEVNPSWAKGYSRLGTTLFRIGKHAQAADAYSKGLEREPGSVELRKSLLEAQQQHVASQAAADRVTRPRETITGYVRTHPSLTFQFALRAFLLVNFVMYMLPLGGTMSVQAYRRTLYAIFLVNALGLYGRHGRIRFSSDYLTNVMIDPSVHTVMAALLFVLNRPYLVGIVPMLLLEMTDFLWFMSGLLQMTTGVFSEKINTGVDRFGGAVFGIPNWGSRSVPDRWSAAKSKASEWSAWVEVMFGMILIAELILPRRNLIMLGLYWQSLRIKYMINDSTGRGYIKAAFRTLDARITVVLAKPRCPRLIGVVYRKLKSFLASFATSRQPAPGEGGGWASSLGSSCSVM